jgi:hypothetical protein
MSSARISVVLFALGCGHHAAKSDAGCPQPPPGVNVPPDDGGSCPCDYVTFDYCVCGDAGYDCGSSCPCGSCTTICVPLSR